MTARRRATLLLAAVALLVVAGPAAAQLSGPTQEQVQECQDTAAVAGSIVGVGEALFPNLPHPDQSLDDCDADGISDALEQLPGSGLGDGVAAADDLTVGADAGLVIAGGGLEELVQGPDYRGGNAPTLRENYGLAALELRDANAGGLDAITNPTQTLNHGLARMTLTVAHTIVGVATALLEWSYSPDLLDPVYGYVQGIVDVLRPAIVGGWASVAIVAGLTWVGWRILTRRTADGMGGLLWMLAALAVGTWFLTAPGHYLATATGWTTAASGHILGALATSEPDTTATASAPDTATYLAEDFVGPPTTDVQPTHYGQVLRRTSDRMYRTLAYEPWTVMQFGSVEAGRRWGHPYLVASTITTDEVAAIRNGETTIQTVTDQRTRDLDALLERIESEDAVTYEWLVGDHSGSQLGIAVLALVAALAAGLVIAVVAFAMLFLQLLAVLLVAVSPIIAVLAAYPGPFGRTLVQRYLHTLLGTFLQRIVLAVLLGVLILIYGLLLGSSEEIGWFATLIAIVLTSVAIVHFRGQLLYLITGGTTGAEHAGEHHRRRLLAGAAALGGTAVHLGQQHLTNRRLAGLTRTQGRSGQAGGGGGDGHEGPEPTRPGRGPAGGTDRPDGGSGGPDGPDRPSPGPPVAARRAGGTSREPAMTSGGRTDRGGTARQDRPAGRHEPADEVPATARGRTSGAATAMSPPVSGRAPSDAHRRREGQPPDEDRTAAAGPRPTPRTAGSSEDVHHTRPHPAGARLHATAGSGHAAGVAAVTEVEDAPTPRSRPGQPAPDPVEELEIVITDADMDRVRDAGRRARTR